MSALYAGLGALVRERRKALGVSLRDLSAACALSKGYLSELENSRQRAPTIATIAAIASALNTTAHALLMEAYERGLRETR